MVELPAGTLDALATPDFPLLVPRGFVARMRKRDPLLLQVLPRSLEADTVPGFTADPVREQGLADGGVIQKYPGRALLNQSVLLHGVNDSVDALANLSERLFECGVLPYYLHLLDAVAGAAHFDVDADVGREIVAQLRARLPGYLVPRLVRETPGELSKTLIG